MANRNSQNSYINNCYVGGSGLTVAVGLGDYLGNSSPVVGLVLTTTQRVTVTGGSGTFTLAFKGQTTSAIPRMASASGIVSALSALSTVGSGNVAVTGPHGGPWAVSLIGALSGTAQPALTVDTSGLSPEFPTPGTTSSPSSRVDVDDSSSGFSDVGNWQRVGYGLGGGHKELSSQGNGDFSANWDFGTIGPGYYRVFASWTYGTRDPSTSSSGVPYRVTDGTTCRNIFTIDQTKMPLFEDPGGNQMSAVCAFYSAGGDLNISLTDQTTGIISADQISIVPCNPTAPVSAGLNTVGGYVGTWSGFGGGYSHPVFATAATTAQDSGTCSLGGLVEGTYSVQVNWEPDAGRSTQALYRVYDGNSPTPLLSVTVNQTQATPADATVGGFAFKTLGTVTCLSGRLNVTVTAPDSATKTLSVDTAIVTLVSTITPTESVFGAVSILSTGSPPQIVINGGTPIPLKYPVWHATSDPTDYLALPYVIYPLSEAISPGANVVLQVDANAITAGAGPVAAETAFPVVNASGGTILPPPPSTRTMRVGYNLHTPNTIATVMYSNLLKGSGQWLWGAKPEGTYTNTGYPIVTGSGVVFTVVRASPGNVADPRGYSNGPYGYYTVFYDGDGTGTPDILLDTGVLYSVVHSDTGHATGNKVVFNLYQDNTASPLPYFSGFGLVIRSTAAGTPMTNIRLYDPSIVDPVSGLPVSDVSVTSDAAVPKWHPMFTRQLPTSATLRSAFLLGSNSSGIAEYSDYPSPQQRSFGSMEPLKKYFNVVKIEGYANTENFLLTGYDHMLVTVDRAHGMVTGQDMFFYPPPGGPDPGRIRVQTSAGYAELSFYNGCILYNPATMATNQFAVATTDSVTGSPVTTTYTNGGTVTLETPSVPPSDYLELVNSIPGCDAWINLPPAASDDLITQLFTLVKNTLDSGRKIYVELSNEFWNPEPGYPQFFYYAGLGQQAGQNNVYGYVTRFAHMLEVATTALGSRSSDMVRVYGSLAAVPDVTTQVLGVAHAHGYPVDAICIAPYTESFPKRETAFDAYVANFNVDQVLDVMERYSLEEHPRTLQAEPHRKAMNVYYPDAALIDYEGSIGGMGLGVSNTVYTKQSQAAWHHPRYFGIYMHYFDTLQKGGITLHAHLTHSYPFIGEGVNPSVLYGAYMSWNQPPGKNDGNGPNHYDVRPDIAGVPPGPANQLHTESVIGAAVIVWNTITKKSFGKRIHRFLGRFSRSRSRTR